MTNNTESKFYALLIGINYYESFETYPQLYKNLGGCVRDIDLVNSYLEKRLKIPAKQIWKLTAPVKESNILQGIRAKAGEILPTYKNIVKAFAEITATANSGDQVYIHYSGHGGRVKTIFPEIKEGGENDYDEALVPMDMGENGYYLRDVEMTTLLKRMTEKGLIVTVIFDSCHSGGVTRGDGDIRGSKNGEPDNTKDRPRDSAVAETRQELIDNWLEETNNSNKDSWLPSKTRDYVFLGACRPTEYAYESVFEGQERNGALTFWMIDVLNSLPVSTKITYQNLYDSVKGVINNKFPKQLPMLLGEGNRFIFGDQTKEISYTLNVTDIKQDRVTLDGGMAQGLRKGMRFSIYPLESDFSDRQEIIAVVELTELFASTSIARILSLEESKVSAVVEKIQLGLPAVMESTPLDLKYRVRLFPKEVGAGEDDLPQALAERQTSALEMVRAAMQDNGWLTEVKDDEENAHYQVAVDREGNYEISKSGDIIKNITPVLNIADPNAPKAIVKRLVHLGKYESVEMLENPASKLSLKFELLDENEKPFPQMDNLKLKSGTVHLRITNNSNFSVNIAILDLEATWQVTPLPIQGQDTAFYQLPAGTSLTEAMNFYVPEGDVYKDKKEKFKLFATKGMANFKWLELPSLDEEIGKKGKDLNEELQEIVIGTEATRGAKQSVSPLNQLLSQIGADLDSPPEINRGIRPKPSPNADWIAKTIEVGFDLEE